MSAAAVVAPPAPLWSDELTGLSVWLNGAFVEITMNGFDGGWSGRLTVEQVTRVDTAGFGAALVAAAEWAERWDADTHSYLQPQPQP
ncbi:hypothetical protein SEA_PHISHY_36 [Gordonia phage Phishy]|nr:hypothetical protein SEA_PHISHY_36 [Gordonia phage Phishy]